MMNFSAFSLRGSIAARLALGYGLLAAASIGAISGVFYFRTVGVFERSIDAKITSIAEHLRARYQEGGQRLLEREIEAQLSDRIDSDTEIVLLLAADGRTLAGNLASWTGPLPPRGQLVNRDLQRDGAPIAARLIMRHLDGGLRLVVGRDLRELDAIVGVIERALVAGFGVSLLLAFGGALIFRRQVEGRIGTIRGIAGKIAAGDLSRRIAVHGDDEFARLSDDINRMLDRIEELMDGVRHVSNSIAHDLRTPLGRVRARLDNTLLTSAAPEALASGARQAIEDIDGVIVLIDKLLQIAAAESGMRTTSFETLDLHAIATDIVELYDAAADEQDISLAISGTETVETRGDRHLLASALANLIDNAVKYGGPGARVCVSARRLHDGVTLVVRDTGPGVPASELGRLCERFYRVDRSRHLPGNGLGLAIVSAIARLHGGRLTLNNLAPGFEACLHLP